MDAKKLIGATAIAALLAGGGAAAAAAGGGGPGGGRAPGARLEAAATALDMTVDELRDALDADTSLADVAAERNVPVQPVIDALVAQATERITAMVNGERPVR